MHEMGIALQIVEIAVSSIPPGFDNVPVEKVNLKVGKLTSIVPKSLRFCFNIVNRDTPLAGAILSIEEVPIEAECFDCEGKSIISEPPFHCAKCGSPHINLLSGRELLITSIEMAEPDTEKKKEKCSWK